MSKLINESTKSKFYYVYRIKGSLYILFCLFVGALSFIYPVFIPIALTAVIIKPSKYFMNSILDSVTESTYNRFSPIIYLFTTDIRVAIYIIFTFIPIIYFLFDTRVGWSTFGSFSHFVTTVCILLLIWSSAVRPKNWYFNRWHPIERISTTLIGIAAILSPLFILLFLIIQKINQSQYTKIDIGGSSGRFALAEAVLFGLGSLSVINIFVAANESHAAFIVLTVFGATYFYTGVSKMVDHGLIYYITKNNPTHFCMNYYILDRGIWSFDISDKWLVKMGNVGDIIKPFINLYVVAVEIMVVFVLFSLDFAIIIVSAVILLHLGILLLTGINFWIWYIVDMAILISLILFSPMEIFFGSDWLLLSILMILTAPAWLRKSGYSWICTPYLERMEIVGELDNRENEKVTINPRIFRPYDRKIFRWSQGGRPFSKISELTGAGGVHSNDVYEELCECAVEKSLDQIKCDTSINNKEMLEQKNDMKKILERFINTEVNDSSLSFVSPPGMYYKSKSIDSTSIYSMNDINKFDVYKIDGIWTNDGFKIINKEKILEVSES